MKLAMFKRALKMNGLTLIMGTDAGAGAHGRSAEEIIYRVQVAGQPAADALVGRDVAEREIARAGESDRRARARHGR